MMLNFITNALKGFMSENNKSYLYYDYVLRCNKFYIEKSSRSLKFDAISIFQK